MRVRKSDEWPVKNNIDLISFLHFGTIKNIGKRSSMDTIGIITKSSYGERCYKKKEYMERAFHEYKIMG